VQILKWAHCHARTTVINNFKNLSDKILAKAGVNRGTFHGIRRTAITSWFYEGLEIVEVMKLTGHTKYETTLKYYLHVNDDLVDKARTAIRHRVSRDMLERCLGRE
jgi:integrase